jgi:cyclase
MLHAPAAHTDGDVMVWFRRSDVVATGDVYSTVTYPQVNLKRGGSVQGLLDALNRVLDIAVPEFNNQGGTLIVPGHGRICNESDVAEYRDMITIVRDRIQAMVEKGMTLAQVTAAGPAKDYDPLYSTPAWTTDMFVETVYTDLTRRQKDGKVSQTPNSQTWTGRANSQSPCAPTRLASATAEGRAWELASRRVRSWPFRPVVRG